jgi:thiol-disulfide isomerase/thioredoxin
MKVLAMISIACLWGCGSDRPADTAIKQPPSIDAAPELGVAIGDGRVDARLVNEPGQLVPLGQILVPGKVTVIDFWADWCAACEVMEAKLYQTIADEPGIAVRKLDIVDDLSPVSMHYRVGRMLPEMRVYDQQGKLVHQLIGNDCLKVGDLALELAGRGATGSVAPAGK